MRTQTLDRLNASQALSNLAEVDLIIEAIVEDLSIKQALFRQLEELCSVLPAVASLFHQIGIQLFALDDLPGLIVQRTVCMLANLAADAVNKNVCTEEDVNTAMVSGTGYPIGPLAWTRQLG